MDLLNSKSPGALALDRLSDAASQELLMRSYTRRAMDRHKRVWERDSPNSPNPRGGVNE